MLPPGSREHSAAFEEHLELHLIHLVVHVGEDEGLAIECVTNASADRRKSFHLTFPGDARSKTELFDIIGKSISWRGPD